VWKPTTGTVRLDNADLTQWPRDELGPHIGYVPQDVELFPGTVAENIARLGKVDSALVVQAALRAHVHEMILALPEGYDTPVDPAGALLSPGQRQRLALARALYGDPKLLILDEPNSNLDGAGENALAATLRDLRGKVTVVVVTHRNTLIQHVDKMLVLEGGRTQHYGPAAEVMKAMQQPKGAAPVPAGAQPAARQAVNAGPPVNQGERVVDMLETIHRTGARAGRGRRRAREPREQGPRRQDGDAGARPAARRGGTDGVGQTLARRLRRGRQRQGRRARSARRSRRARDRNLEGRGLRRQTIRRLSARTRYCRC